MKKFNLFRCVVCLLLICCVLLNISPIKVHATGMEGTLAGAFVSVPAAPVFIAILAAIGVIILTTEFRDEIIQGFTAAGEALGIVKDGNITVYKVGDVTYLPADIISDIRNVVLSENIAHYIPDLNFSTRFTGTTVGDVYKRTYTYSADSPFTIFKLQFYNTEAGTDQLALVLASSVSQIISFSVTAPNSSGNINPTDFVGNYYYHYGGWNSNVQYASDWYPEFPIITVGSFSSVGDAYDHFGAAGLKVGSGASTLPVDATGYRNPALDIPVAYPNWTGSVADTAGNIYYPVTVPPTVDEASQLTQDEAQVGVVIVVPGTGSDSDPDPTEPVILPPDVPDIDNPDTPDIPSDGTELNTGFFQGLLDQNFSFFQGLWDQLGTLFTTYIVNPIKEFWLNTLASLDLLPGWYILTEAFETYIVNPLTSIWDNTVASIQAGTFWETLGETILSPIKWLADHLLSGISSLFFPSQDFLTAKVEALLERFSFLRSIVDSGKAIGESLSGIDTEPPIIYAELGDSTGKYDYGERAVVLDMRWYADYKPTVDAILSAVFWALFCWRMFIHAPNIISGVASNVGHVVTSYQRDSNRRQK